jgi:hypothetical protein
VNRPVGSLTVSEAASITRLTAATIRRYITSQKLSVIEGYEKPLYIPIKDIEALGYLVPAKYRDDSEKVVTGKQLSGLIKRALMENDDPRKALIEIANQLEV